MLCMACDTVLCSDMEMAFVSNGDVVSLVTSMVFKRVETENHSSKKVKRVSVIKDCLLKVDETVEI